MNAPRTAIAATALLWLACTDPAPTGPAEEATSEPDGASGAPAPALQVGANADGEEIHACVKNGSGVLYQGEECKKKDEEISWNRQGPPGPRGEPGVSGYEVVENLNPLFASGSATAECPAGKRVLGGGYRIRGISEQDFDKFSPVQNHPLIPGVTKIPGIGKRLEDFGWRVLYRYDGVTTGREILVYAICASVEE